MQFHRFAFKLLLILCLLAGGILLHLGNSLAQEPSGATHSAPVSAITVRAPNRTEAVTVRFDGVTFSPVQVWIAPGDAIELWNDTDLDYALSISFREESNPLPPAVFLPLVVGAEQPQREQVRAAEGDIPFPARSAISLSLDGGEAWSVALAGFDAIRFDVDLLDIATPTVTPTSTPGNTPAPTAAPPTATPTPSPIAGGLTVDIRNKQSVKEFFETYYERAPLPQMEWTGSHATCDAGSTSATYRQSLQNLVNFFRAMAGVPANVTFLDEYNAKAQQAALMMSVNRQLSHDPTENWQCYTADGAEGAGNSNLSYWYGQGGDYHGIKGQMKDDGANNYPVGHRRWILCPATLHMGTGDVPGNDDYVSANALWVFDDSTWGTRPAVRDDFVAWPPSGYVPDTLIYARWSLMLRRADFSAATVTVRYSGAPLSVDVEPQRTGYCENTLVWIPSIPWHSLDANQDHRFEVEIANVTVDGVTRSFSYDVTIFFADYDGPPVLDLTPESGGAGTLVTAYGKGFTANTSIELRLGKWNPDDGYYWFQEQPYASGATDGSGRYVLTFTMPATWPDGSAIAQDEVLVNVNAPGGSDSSAYDYFDFVTDGATRRAP